MMTSQFAQSFSIAKKYLYIIPTLPPATGAGNSVLSAAGFRTDGCEICFCRWNGPGKKLQTEHKRCDGEGGEGGGGRKAKEATSESEGKYSTLSHPPQYVEVGFMKYAENDTP